MRQRRGPSGLRTLATVAALRDILTALAVILIVVLTTLLVAPYFVDWNGQRAFLETQLSRAFGQTVTIGGTIDLKLLPTPYIRLNQTVIGGDEGAVRVGIHHLDLELAVAPLLHGEFDVVEGRLDEPTIRLTLQPDRTLPVFPETPALKADIRLERITVKDGTLAVADPASGRTFGVDHLDFTADAPSLAGPFKGSGAAGADAGRTKFRFSTAEAKKGRSHLHLALGETATHPGLDLDGDVALEPGRDGVRQSFEGTVTAIGHLLPSEGASLAWRLSGPLKADPAGARLAGGELRLGGEDAGLAFKADVAGTFGANAAVAATLSAQQLDVDRLAGAPADPAKPNPPPQLPSPSRLRALAAAAIPAVPTTLDVTVDGATWGGEALSDLALHVKPTADGAGTLQASGDAPGGLQLAIDGALTGSGAGFAGQAKLAAGDLPRALAWLGMVAPDLAPSRGALPFSEAALSGTVTVDAGGLAAKNAALDLDRSHFKGSLRLAYSNGTREPRLAADLHTDLLDLDALPDARGLRRDASSLAIDLKLTAGAARVASFGSGTLEAGRVALDVAAGGGRVDLRVLSVENLGGATLVGKGTIEADKATLDAGIDAERLDAAAALARQVAPGPWADALAARASTLAPAHLKVDATLFSAKAGGKLAPSRLTLAGTLAGTRVAASLSPEGGGTTKLTATADAFDGTALLRQLGLPVVPTAAPVGAGRFALSASGDIEGPLATKLDAGLGATRFAIDGRFDLLGKGKGGSGTAELKSADVGPLLRALGLTSPDAAPPGPTDLAGAIAVGQNGVALSDIRGRVAGTGIAGTLKIGPESGDAPVLTGTLDLDRIQLGALTALVLGPGKPPAPGAAWSNEPFAAPAAPPRAELALRARILDLPPNLSANDASLDLRLAPGLVAVSHAEATLGGGRLGGAFALRRDGRQATLEGSLTADKVALDLPALKARLTGKLEVAGGGGTAVALVSSLAGSGTADLADARVPGADPAALPHVLSMVEEDALAVDDEAVTRAFEEAAKAPLAAGSRPGTLGLAGGTLALTPTGDAVAPAGGPVSSEIGAALDLRTLRLAVRATETLHALPKDWSGPPPSIVVTQAGPLAAPRRTFDVGSFLNAVAARAIARESARLETYEFDIRERALFNARLQSEHRREADRLKAEADAKATAEAARRAAAELARKAEADRRAKAEAARLEKQRDGAAPVPAPASPDPPGFQAQPPGTSGDPAAAGRY